MSRALTILAVAASLAAGCTTRPAPDIAPVTTFAGAAPAPEGTHRLEAVDDRPLPVRLQVPRDSKPGVATPPGMEVIAGVIWFPIGGGAQLTLRVRLLDCGPANRGRGTAYPRVCRPTPQEPTVGGEVPFTYDAGRITVAWPADASGPAEVAEGTVRGDTITLDLPFRRVYGPGRADARWTQRFTFVRMRAED